MLYLEQKKYELAEKDYDKIIILSPDYVKSYVNRGSIYYAQKRYRLAMMDWEKAISLGFSDKRMDERLAEIKALLHKQK